MFCVECGQEKPIYKDGVCTPCYIKSHQFSKGPIYIDIYTCAHCNAYKYKNTWFSESFDDILRRMIKDTFTISKELGSIIIQTPNEQQDKVFSCAITISGKINDTTITETHNVTIRIKKITCDICSRQKGGYYEATIQIRADQRKIPEDELNEIKTTVEKFIQSIIDKGNRALFITDTFEQHGGVDFYLSEKGSAQSIAKKIVEQYGGEITMSSKNIGMEDTKQIYRMTYLVRLPRYCRGDFIEYNNQIYYIASISSTRVHLVDLKTWSEQVINGKHLQKVRILGGSELHKEMILVSQSNDEVQLMDTKNYKTFDIRKPKKIFFENKTVLVVVIEDTIFLLPEKNTNDK